MTTSKSEPAQPSTIDDPQVQASDPTSSVFVAANAGSGKTSTLVKRVARLLLAGARPEAILCVTYTKAGAAEMQRRLFRELGEWAVARDDVLAKALDQIDEGQRKFSTARALFARALETPGGLKIQTIHAFCEQLLRRFPLEAGVSPGFTVMDDVTARAVSQRARDDLAEVAQSDPSGRLAQAYRHFSIDLDWLSFNAMFDVFAERRAEIAAYAEACETRGGFVRDVWRRCGFGEPTSVEEVEHELVSTIRWSQWARAADALLEGSAKTDHSVGLQMKAIGPRSTFADIWAVFSTQMGEPKVKMATRKVDAWAAGWLAEEQGRQIENRNRLLAARLARDSAYALALALAYGGLYEGAKAARGSLDFADLIRGAHRLLTQTADATWVLYKLDGGLEHVLLDEGQDTAPEQWDILWALTAEFFVGLGAGPVRRTVFAVADEKQSIFSFQGAAPERFTAEKRRFEILVTQSGFRFSQAALLESWRSAPEILTFVDKVFTDRCSLEGLRPGAGDNVVDFPLTHRARRPPGGCVDLWPLESVQPGGEPDPWAPLDSEPDDSANRKLARNIARAIVAMIARGEGVLDRKTREIRPCGYGDILILVRRRSPLFHEIIRALKREGAPVGGADRLKLSEHGVFEDLLALARIARFPPDDLTLAAVLRGPFCDVAEDSLFDLAHGRRGLLWSALIERAAERPEWAAAAALLAWTRQEAARSAPFEFFSRLLERSDDAGRSMRQRLFTRMGAEGEDAAEAFLAETLAAEDRGARDLDCFISAMSVSEIEVKREAEEAARAGEGEVRVMTVHGAKGLEAPIVILPDTSTRASDRAGRLLAMEDGGFLWAPRKGEDCLPSAAALSERSQAAEHESSRLLYVALTRARDRLIICGVETRDAQFRRSWRDYVERAFADLPWRAIALDDGREGRRFGVDPTSVTLAIVKETAVPAEPAWVRKAAPVESPVFRYVSPSTIGDDAKAPATSPIADVGDLGRFRRGDIIHRLLQMLPELPPDRRADAASLWLERERDLTQDQRAEMASSALAVLSDHRFGPVFGPGSKAEVAMTGVVAGRAISGRVDRLIVGEERVLVIDFKTNRPAPKTIEGADPAYIRQMALYVALLREIFPGRAVEAALLWTDGPVLMPAPDGLMDAAIFDMMGTT